MASRLFGSTLPICQSQTKLRSPIHAHSLPCLNSVPVYTPCLHGHIYAALDFYPPFQVNQEATVLSPTPLLLAFDSGGVAPNP